MFYSGPNGDSWSQIHELIEQIGLNPIWVGDNDRIHLVDNMGALWVNMVWQRGWKRRNYGDLPFSGQIFNSGNLKFKDLRATHSKVFLPVDEFTCLLPQLLPERFCQRRHDLEQIANYSITRLFKDRSIRVLVDRHDQFCVPHPNQMLDRAGDAAGDVQIRRDDLTGLPNLVGIGNITRVHSRA